MSNTSVVTHAISQFKNRHVVNSTFYKSYTEYWDGRSSSTSVIEEVQDNVFSYIRERTRSNYASKDNARNDDSSTSNENVSADITNHLNDGQAQFKLFAGSSVINIDDERLMSLMNKEMIQVMKDDTELPSYKLTEGAATLLVKLEESVPSSRKLRSIIRKSIRENDDFDLMEIYDINFIETLSNH